MYKKETEAIRNTLKDFKCGDCSALKNNEKIEKTKPAEENTKLELKFIGYFKK